MSDQASVRLINNSEFWGGLIWLALGVFVIWPGFKLKLGSINEPGSGYVLFYTGILMCAVRGHHHRRGRDQGGPTFASLLGRTRAGPSRCWSSRCLVGVCASCSRPLGFPAARRCC